MKMNDMDRRTLVAVVLMLIILFAYQYYADRNKPRVSPPQRQEEPRSVPSSEEEERPTLAEADLYPAAPRSQPAKEKDIVVETDVLRVVVSNRGGQIKSWQLKKYLESDGTPVDIIGKRPEGHETMALRTWSGNQEASHGIYSANLDQLLLSEEAEKGTLVLRHRTSTGLELTKSITFFQNDYKIDLETRVKNMGRREGAVTFDLLWGPGIRGGGGSKDKPIKPVTTLVNGQRVQDKWEKLDRGVKREGTVSWTAIHDNYFCAALIPLEKGGWAQVEKIREAGPLVGLAFSKRRLLPGESASESYSLFVGPKEIERLTRMGLQMREIIDLGWFDFLARPALHFLKYTQKYLKNYGLAIIVLTFLVRIILFPLTYKSIKSMQDMQKLQPKMSAIRERFKGDSKRMNQELMDLYRKHNISPLGGCLPMLLQVPIFIALYNALINSVELWKAPFVWWIRDLSSKDPFYVLPILMGASWVIQQAMTPTVGDPRQAKMMLLMPIVFTFMFLNFPSGLVLYFLVSNLLGIGQQLIINRQLKTPSPAGG
jgi:YidC/Oxa1 family membrane protein insertase